MVRVFQVIGLWMVVGSLFLTGCHIRHQSALPVGDGRYLLERRVSDWAGMTEKKRTRGMEKLAKGVCPDYRLVSEASTYCVWSGWSIQWVIECPDEGS